MSINVLYTTVTVCLPGTSTCQTIDNIQVDTGSYGLRILAPVLTQTMTFPVLTLGNGSALLECTSFVDGYSWGPVTLADVQVAGETASSVPVQIIGDSRYPSVPTDCSNSAPMAEDTVATFGANGLLGIGPFPQDCGDFCVVERAPAARFDSITRAPPSRIARARPCRLQVRCRIPSPCSRPTTTAPSSRYPPWPPPARRRSAAR